MKLLTYNYRDLREGQQLVIGVIGDVHYDTEACDRDRFHEALEELAQARANGAKVMIGGVGDYFDAVSPSERNVLASGKSGYGMHESTYEWLDEIAEQKAARFVEALTPVKGSVQWLLDGHHFMRFCHEKQREWFHRTTTEWMCEKLGADYGGVGVVNIEVNLPHRLQLRIVAGHGYGSARTVGARANKRVGMGAVMNDAHFYFMGHDNSLMAIAMAPLRRQGKKMKELKQYFVGTGSFQRGYMEAPHTSYVEQVMLVPNGLGMALGVVWVRNKKLFYRVMI